MDLEQGKGRVRNNADTRTEKDRNIGTKDEEENRDIVGQGQGQ